MATSLAAQLQRLATPQTASLVESKSRPSILYDPKEAANIDLRTIFDLGKNGLDELIILNSEFRQFETTLFDESTIELVRAVESKTVNDALNKNIRKFLFQLSPHFMKRAAHNCLEWLIRRHCIHEYNVDDFVALILPYHESMTFVKCLQTIPLQRSNRWEWLLKIQKPGVPLSKQALFNRAASDIPFFKFILDTTSDAVKELGFRAHTLQTLFAFYVTTTLGALKNLNDVPQLPNLYEKVLKGLSSEVVDYCAASMIILGYLYTNIRFSDYFVERTIVQITKNIARQQLPKDSLVLLTIAFQTQTESLDTATETLMSRLVDNSSMTAALGDLYNNDNMNVLAICLPVITKCLRESDSKKMAKAHQFVEMLLTALNLNNDDAKAVIRCILNALKTTPKPPPTDSDVIEVLSDDEDNDQDVHMAMSETEWHSSLMRILETRYATVFDAVKTDIMSSQDEESCALKIVIGTLLCSTHNADPSGASVFVDLYHPNAQNRMRAVETLVNMKTMPYSDDKKNLLVAGIAERMNDDDPKVVNEVLKFKTEDLIKSFGEQSVIKKLQFVIGDQFMAKKKWQSPVRSAIQHITSKQLLRNDNEVEIFLTIWPYMFPMNESSFSHAKTITESCIASRFPILKRLPVSECNVDDNKNQLERIVKELGNSFDKSKINEIVQFVKTIPDTELTTMSAFHIINLLTHALPKNSDHKLSNDVFDIASRIGNHFDFTSMDIDQYIKALYSRNRPMKLPLQSLVNCIEAIIEKTDFSAVLNAKTIDFTIGTGELILMKKLHDHLCTGIFKKSKTGNALYNQAMTKFIGHILTDIDKQMDFYSNYLIGHYVNLMPQTPNSIYIDPESQLRSIRIFNQLLKRPAASNLKEISMEVFLRIISGLTSPFEALRVLTSDVISNLYEVLPGTSDYSKWLELIRNESEKFSKSPEDLSEFLFHTKHKRDQLFKFVQQPDSAMILKATLLNMVQLITDTKYLETVVDVAWNILQNVDASEPIYLNRYESIVVYQAIIRFNLETMALITRPGKCQKFFEFVLLQSNVSVFADFHDEWVSISMVAMKQLKMFSDFKKFNAIQQKFIIDSIVKVATFAKFTEIRTRASKFFQKSIELDGAMELDILTKMAKITSTVEGLEKNLPCKLLQSSEWKCGVTLLEFLHKKQLTNPLGLVRQLNPILQKCFYFEDQSLVEYTKQLLLIDMLNCCTLLPMSSRPFRENDFETDFIVKCVRDTQNPQTHHHALQLITKLATMIPDAILRHLVEIFTFVGNNVIKRDDDYIYQLIANVIKSVVPILKENNIIQVLREFSWIAMDVPSHRRSALYEDLLKTLDPQKYLWMFLAILFEHKLRPTNDTRESDSVRMNNKKTQIAIEITNLFDCDIILQTSHQLIKFLRSQLSAVDKRSEISADLKSLFNAEHYDRQQIVRYIYRIVNFVNVLTMKKSEFFTKMASLEKASLPQHKETFKNLIPALLKYIKESSQSTIRSSDIVWNGSFNACYHILDNLLDLLYPDMLLRVVNTLLSEKNRVEVREQVIDLLNKKLHSPELFADCDDSILSLLAPLSTIVSSLDKTPTITKLQKYALVSVRLMSRIAARNHVNEFVELLGILSKIIKTDKFVPSKPIELRVYVVQCVGELVANLRVDAVAYVYKFMPGTTDVLCDLLAGQIDVGYEITLTAILKIVETMPLLLSPYLKDLIGNLSILWSRLQTTSSNDSHKNLLILDGIWQKLATSIELRVLIPEVENHIYPSLLTARKFDAIGPMMVLLSESFQHSEQADLVQSYKDLSTFFLDIMDFRSKYYRECATVDVQEDMFIKTLVGFILKLSEASFRPFYHRLLEWSKEDAEQCHDRAITFYRLSNKIAESLKSLFLVFAKPIIQNAAELLKAEIRTSSARPTTLIFNILSTLQTIFLHNNSPTINFNVLLEPLVDVLDHEEYLTDASIYEILPKCFAQFAVSAKNELLWEKLIRHILMKTRSNSVLVRRCGLICSVEVVIQLGEDSTQLYPEIIPFYSELLEDDDTEIQRICNRSITEIEKVTREDLKKHL